MSGFSADRIVFFADTHYDSHAGRQIAEALKSSGMDVDFYENDWNFLESGKWEKDCKLLILHLIGESCKQPHPGSEAERVLKRYCERGAPILLLHGSSAAFWQWDWWREIVGLRWVRPDDPDGAVPSIHPVKPYRVEVCKSRHPLVRKLKNLDLPEDEIYIGLEYTAPIFPLMETRIEEGTFIQAWECVTSWGGEIIGFLPGHRPEALATPGFSSNIQQMIDYLLP